MTKHHEMKTNEFLLKVEFIKDFQSGIELIAHK